MSIWIWLAIADAPVAPVTNRYPYYQHTAFAGPTVADWTPRAAAEYVEVFAERKYVAKIEAVRDGVRVQAYPRRGRAIRLDELESYELASVYDLLRFEIAGAETDLLVKVPGESWRMAVTAKWEVDGTVVVQAGAKVPVDEPTLDRETLLRRWPIDLRETEAAKWDDTQFYLIDQAMQLLSDDERALIDDLPFVRVDRTIRGSHIIGRRASAQYSLVSLDFFGVIKDPARTVFRGEPDHPIEREVMTYVHEVGHAIADVPGRRWLGQMGALAWERTRLTREAGTESKDRIAAIREELATSGFNVALVDEVMEQRRTATPVESAFATVRGPLSNSVDAYGQTNEKESFAEAFAFFKVDPKAMERANPEQYAWFAAGNHVRVAREELAELMTSFQAEPE